MKDITKSTSKYSLKEITKPITKQVTKQVTKTPTITTTRFPGIPRIPGGGLLGPPISFKGKGRTTKKTKQRRYKEDLYYVPSFTSQELGLVGDITPKQLKKIAGEPYSLEKAGIRQIPSFKWKEIKLLKGLLK